MDSKLTAEGNTAAITQVGTNSRFILTKVNISNAMSTLIMWTNYFIKHLVKIRYENHGYATDPQNQSPVLHGEGSSLEIIMS